MKRALALLEQTKNTMPNLPRPISGNNQDSDSDNDNKKQTQNSQQTQSLQYQKHSRRNPSAQGRTRILGSNSNTNEINNTNPTNGSSSKLLNNNSELQSRKSTAVSQSSTNRVGSSSGIMNNNGQSARNNKRVSFTGANTTGSFNAADIIEKEKQQQQQPLYELSLKSTTNKKPHKLKPLSSAKLNIDNKATSILEIENAYQKEIMKDIEQDLNDYLDTNQIFSQMQTAFGGPSPSTALTTTNTLTQKKKASNKQQSNLNNTTTNNQLDMILEEDAKQVGSLVVYQPNATAQEIRQKKNEALKMKVKMLTNPHSDTSSQISQNNNNVSQQLQSNETDTFITGTKIQNKQYDGDLAIPDMDDKMMKEYESHLQQRKKKYYKYEEDELLDDLDQHERDMNEMLKYLSEVEDMIKGQDLKSIQQMMDVTKETMTQHFQACDKFKGHLQDLDNQAEAAIKILNFYDSDGKNIDGSKNNGKGSMQLQRVIEDIDEKAAEIMDKKLKPSQEQSKHLIVNKLNNMNRSIRDFTSDLESRLDRAYKTGATKKFGYDGLVTASQVTAFEDEKKEERALNKIQSQAQQFIDQNSASSILKSGTPNSSYSSTTYARKNSNNGIKALPSSQGQIETGAQKRKSSVKNMRPKILNNKSTTLNSDISLY